jgi:protein kinase C substrate 80K-H
VTVALPGFYCKNKGHVPGYIPFTYVNDGVCDWDVCCDGSDEWEGVGGVKCEDKCAAMGKEHKKKEQEKEKAALAAGKKRAELVKDAAALKNGIREKIQSLEREVQALQVKAKEAKIHYEEVERRERGRIVTGGSDKATKATVLARLAKRRVEELREALVETIQKRDTAREKVKELEAILTTFKEEYNPNFNDEGVKRAVKAWEDYAAAKDSVEPDVAAAERDLQDIVKPDSEAEGINWAEFEAEEEESDIDARMLIPASPNNTANDIQCTVSKSTYLQRCVPGFMRSFVTCG